MFPNTLSNPTCTPCRKIIRKGHRNFAHFFPSIKNGISVGCESHLEAECCFLLEFDRDIARYHPQPHSFEWADAGKNYFYTPDFLVRRTDGSFYLLEVKPDFGHLQDSYQDKLESFSTCCRNQGWSYQQWSAAKIRDQENLDTLKQLYSRSHHIVAADKFFFTEAAQNVKWPITLGQLIKQMPQFSINLICHFLFYQALQADLSQAVTLDFLIDGLPCHGQSAA